MQFNKPQKRHSLPDPESFDPHDVVQIGRLYEVVYKAGSIPFPKKGMLQAYGAESHRDPWFVRNIVERCARGSSILDAGCGRGHLMIVLRNAGYVVHGTEIVPYILTLKEMKGLDVRMLAYQEFHKIEDNSFDVVCSNDVMEHLPDEETIIQALRDIARIARQYVLISVGVTPARKFPRVLQLPILDLHMVRRPRAWWEDKVGSIGEICDKAENSRSSFFCVRVAS